MKKKNSNTKYTKSNNEIKSTQGQASAGSYTALGPV